MRRRPVLLALVAVTALAACKKSSSTSNDQPKASTAPEVVGLAAVPNSAEVVIGVDVARLGGSPLVTRAVDQLLLRDGDLAARWTALRDGCKIDLLTQVKRVMLAIGPRAAGGQPGTGPVLMIATGDLGETALSACVRGLVGKGGGELTAKTVDGRTLYQAKDSGRTMFFGFGRADTVVMGSDEAYVTLALGPGKKALDNPQLKAWIGLADQQAPVWAAGKVDDRVREGLVRATAGKLTAGPAAMVIAVDPSTGAKLEVGAVMASDADAKALESFTKSQLALIGMAAQARGLGAIVDKVAVAADAAVVRFKVSLTTDEVNQLLSAIDSGGAPTQDAAPSGSAAPPTAPGSASSSGKP
jgi:hypothetical protein